MKLPIPTHILDVHLFYEKHRALHLLPYAPRELPKSRLKERLQFMLEELDEFKKAAGFYQDGDDLLTYDVNTDEELKQDLPGQADALVDLIYVALGTALELGLTLPCWQELWDDVQRANMAKEPGPTKRQHSFDVMKPVGWVPPKTAEILKKHGWEGA